MNHKIKRKWLAALRSGQYQQCRNKYRDGDKYCALGILKHRVLDNPDMIPKALADDYEVFVQTVFKNDILGWNFNKIADWIEKTAK